MYSDDILLISPEAMLLRQCITYRSLSWENPGCFHMEASNHDTFCSLMVKGLHTTWLIYTFYHSSFLLINVDYQFISHYSTGVLFQAPNVASVAFIIFGSFGYAKVSLDL